MVLEAAVLAHRGDEAFALAGIVVERAHAAADRVGDRREAEHARERGVAGEQLAVGPRDVDAEQRAFEQLAIALVDGDACDVCQPRPVGGAAAGPDRS